MAWEWQAIVDPANPTIAYLPIDYKHMGRGQIDYAKGTWTLTDLYDTPDEFGWGANATDRHRGVFPQFGGSYSTRWQVRHVAGQTYLVDTQGGVMVVRVNDKESKLVPVACLGGLHPTVDRRNPPSWWIAALKGIGIDADFTDGLGTDNPKSFTAAGGYKHFAYTWSDISHVWKFSVEGVTLGSIGQGATDCGYFVDDNWNVYGPDPSGKSAWAVIPNESKDLSYPAWNWDHIRAGLGTLPEPGAVRDYWRDKDGSVYATLRYADRAAMDFAPINWPNNSVTADRLVKWDCNGHLLLADGYHTMRKDGPAGGFADLRSVVGEVRGNLVVRGACSPASVWTSDGLYAGKLSSSPPQKFSATPISVADPSLGLLSDDSWGGRVVESPMGSVLWLANDSQNTMVMRIGGWDGWDREHGSIALQAKMAAEGGHGDGLMAEYYNNGDLRGNPVLQRVDRSISFGPMWGDHSHIDAVTAWLSKAEAGKIDPGTCSARWTGFIEPPVSEDFTFTAFLYGEPREDRKIGGKVRVWVDGNLIIDSWDGYEPTTVTDWKRTRVARSSPISLQAGRRVPIKIEYAATGGYDAHLHLFWESLTCDLRHVPGKDLYTRAPPASH